MPTRKRTMAFWIIVIFLTGSILLMLIGQTMSIFNYDLTVRWGLQESLEEVGEHGVQVNRAFGVGDTVIFIPLMIVSLVGLFLRKRWSLLTTAAVVGISAYWSVTIGFMLIFLPVVSGYNYRPGLGIWLFVWAYILFGAWGIFYLIYRGKKLIE